MIFATARLAPEKQTRLLPAAGTFSPDDMETTTMNDNNNPVPRDEGFRALEHGAQSVSLVAGMGTPGLGSSCGMAGAGSSNLVVCVVSAAQSH